MIKWTAMLILGGSLLVGSLRAQTTNVCPVVPATKLEAFDTNISVVVLRASSELGTISASAGAVAVSCREVSDMSTGRKEQGVAIELAERNAPKDTMLIDYDEIAPLLDAIDYLNSLNLSATSLNALRASYTTRGGFRIAAQGARRKGLIQFNVTDSRTGATPIVLSRQEVAAYPIIFATSSGIHENALKFARV